MKKKLDLIQEGVGQLPEADAVAEEPNSNEWKHVINWWLNEEDSM